MGLTNVEIIVLSISIISASIAFFSAIIAWLTFRVRFKPFLSVTIPTEFYQEWCPVIVIKNTGNGVAHKIKLKLKTSKIENSFRIPDLEAKEQYTLKLHELGFDFSTIIFRKIVLNYKDIRRFPHRQIFIQRKNNIFWDTFFMSSPKMEILKGVKDESSTDSSNSTTLDTSDKE